MSKNSKNIKSNQETEIKYSDIVSNMEFERLSQITAANLNLITKESSKKNLQQIKSIINST
jgi:hypothetical protein